MVQRSGDSEGLRLGPPPGSRIALVGGCGGIGRAVTAACVAAGLRVAVLDLPRSLAQHGTPEGVLALPLDATDEHAVGAAFDRFGLGLRRAGRLGELAGFANRPVPFDALSTGESDETVAGNLRSVYLTCRAAVPLLRRGNAPRHRQHRLRPRGAAPAGARAVRCGEGGRRGLHQGPGGGTGPGDPRQRRGPGRGGHRLPEGRDRARPDSRPTPRPAWRGRPMRAPCRSGGSRCRRTPSAPSCSWPVPLPAS